MGAGKKPTNIFKTRRNDDEPKEIFNWRLWFAVISFSIMGAARGVDEGLISGTLTTKNFQELVGFGRMDDTEKANVKANISAMVQIGSVGGALLAFTVADRIGRLWATRQLCLTWIVGTIIFITNNGRLGQIYAGRFIMGLGIGETVVIAPVYISEIAPKSVRGLATCLFSGAVYLGVMLAYFSSWGSSLHINNYSINSWVVPTSMHIMFAGLIFILSFFNYESPRYLIKRGQDDLAIENLSRIRKLPVDHPHVVHEINEIKRQRAEEQEATMGQGVLGYAREIFCMPDNLYRICIGTGSQLFSQWSGAGSLTLYAPDFFALLGTTGQNEKLFATCIFGVVKFVASLACALFLVDVIGRKRSLGIGITLQAVSMLYVAAFLTAVPDVGNGNDTGSEKRAGTGAIVMIYLSGVGWALGWNSLQYLLNAEIYPLRIRTICSSLVMCIHFANQYGNSRAVPNMLLEPSNGGLSPKGTFWFFGAVTVVGGCWAWFFVPETANVSLESMDELFKRPWYQIGRKGREAGKIAQERELARQLDEKTSTQAMEIEVADDRKDSRV